MLVHTITLHAVTCPNVQRVEVKLLQSLGAEVTRTYGVDLKMGRNIVQLMAVSSQIDPESMRVLGLRNDARAIDVSCLLKSTDSPGYKHYRDYHQGPAGMQAALDRRDKLLQDQFVSQQGAALIDDGTRNWLSSHPGVDLNNEVRDFIVRKGNAMEAARAYDVEIVDAHRSIWALDEPIKGDAAAVISVVVLADRDCAMDLALSYRVSGAGWSPCYDLYCTLPEGRTTGDLSLHYSAMVTQSTGEHWTNALLTCVADASLLDTKQQRPSSVSHVQTNTAVQGSDASPTYYASPASSYAIAERMNVRSNGSQHKLPISVLTSTPTFTQVLSAGQDRATATSVEMKNTGGRALPAGNVSIYINGSFASKARTTSVGVDEYLTASLGVDTLLQGSHSRRH
ncbi:hypothetical protein C8Q76DRAFT_434655 [Earliella scabrosa]|nr:hypothetical protein C8Q76DRAFT_434655 [Earliella scabrosa]